jgi:hypothetical protein
MPAKSGECGAAPNQLVRWSRLNTASHSHFFVLHCRRKLFIVIHLI